MAAWIIHSAGAAAAAIPMRMSELRSEIGRSADFTTGKCCLMLVVASWRLMDGLRETTRRWLVLMIELMTCPAFSKV